MARAFRIDMNAANERAGGTPSTSTATALGVAVLTGTGAASRLEYTINVRGLDWGAFTGQAAQTAKHHRQRQQRAFPSGRQQRHRTGAVRLEESRRQ